MIFNLSAKSLTLLLAVGITSTTGSNLRSRRATLFGSGHDAAPNARNNLRASSASEDDAAEEEPATATMAMVSPSIDTEKRTYLEDEPITLTFSAGDPSHPYYSSGDAPSQSVDHNYPKWSIGLFMRDADPQGGTLAPIVSINICGAKGDDCNVNDRDFASYTDQTVTFGSEYSELMEGRWPVEVNQYGTGYDAYVLDGHGAAAIGPLEFSIQNEYDEVVDTTHGHNSYRPKSSASSTVAAKPLPLSASTNPPKRFSKGTERVTERQHASVSMAIETHQANSKIISGNGLEMSSAAVPSDPSIHNVAATEQRAMAPYESEASITSNKDEYEYDDSVSINFSIPNSPEELSNYKIGIFMRMANVQDGSLEPVVSIPLCSNDGSSSACTTTINDLTEGSITFSTEMNMDPEHTGNTVSSEWPIDLYQWGTGFDAYILDERGSDVLGPVKFNIMTNDTY